MLVLTRPEVIDVRAIVTVAEVTTAARGLAVEVELDGGQLGLDRPSAVNCDGLHTIARASLTERIATLDDATMLGVCRAVSNALGC